MPLATFAHNTFNSLNSANHSTYGLVFGRKPKLLLDLETDSDIKVSGTYREYFIQLGKRLEYLQDLQTFARLSDEKISSNKQG